MTQAKSLLLKGLRNPYLQLLALSLALRLLVGAVFFMGVDMMGFTNIIRSGYTLRYLPYFPLINLFFWLSSLIDAMTAMPMALCMKLFLILFDSLTALLVYQIAQAAGANDAFHRALLYALSPVAIIVSCVYGQYDALSIFFLILAFYQRDSFERDLKTQFLFGCYFAVSFLVKPTTLLFLLFFFTPLPALASQWKDYLKHQAASMAGLCVTVLISALVSAKFGYDYKGITLHLLRHANSGYASFGLPVLLRSLPVGFLRGTRLIFLPLLFLLAVPYYRRKALFPEVCLGAFCAGIAFSGLTSFYLLWPVAFLCLCATPRQRASYQIAAIFFLAFFYANPFTSALPYENMAAYATLRGFGFLVPPEWPYRLPELARWIFLWGNCVILPTSAVIFFQVMRGLWRRSSEAPLLTSQASAAASGYLKFLLAFAGVTLAAYLFLDNPYWHALFVARQGTKLAAYSMALHDGYAVGVGASSPFFNAVVLFAAGGVLLGLWDLRASASVSAAFAAVAAALFVSIAGASTMIFSRYAKTEPLSYREEPSPARLRPEEMVHKIPLRTFGNTAGLKLGIRLKARTESGREFIGTIAAIDANEVTVISDAPKPAWLRPETTFHVPLSTFGNTAGLKVGVRVKAKTESGREIIGTITAIDANEATVVPEEPAAGR